MHPDFYVIYRNGTQIATGSWSSGINITIDVDGLKAGIYNFTIMFVDSFGNSASDDVLVTVLSATTSSSTVSTISRNTTVTSIGSTTTSVVTASTLVELVMAVSVLAITAARKKWSIHAEAD